MKTILLAITLSLSCTISLYAQKPGTKSRLEELNLTPAQKHEMQAIILEYKQKEKINRIELKKRLIRILNIRQQAQVLHWRRLPHR